MKYIKQTLFFAIFLLMVNSAMGQAKASDYLKAAIEATNQKKYERAVSLCDAAISLNNTISTAYFHRGYNRLLLKDYQGAIVDFSVCLDLSPDNLSAYLYRAYSNQKAGNKWESSRDYNSARRIDAIETFAFMAGNLFRSSLGD
jgi:tetratricopeptide (TPR) repeat protein